MSSVPVRRFILLNGIGALIWAVLVGSCGYLFGYTLETILGNVKRFEYEVLMRIALTGIVT